MFSLAPVGGWAAPQESRMSRDKVTGNMEAPWEKRSGCSSMNTRNSRNEDVISRNCCLALCKNRSAVFHAIITPGAGEIAAEQNLDQGFTVHTSNGWPGTGEMVLSGREVAGLPDRPDFASQHPCQAGGSKNVYNSMFGPLQTLNTDPHPPTHTKINTT